MSVNLLEKHAKSFYWASFFLSKEIFYKCVSLYNFCRTLDHIVDDASDLEKSSVLSGGVDTKSTMHLDAAEGFKQCGLSNDLWGHEDTKLAKEAAEFVKQNSSVPLLLQTTLDSFVNREAREPKGLGELKKYLLSALTSDKVMIRANIAGAKNMEEVVVACRQVWPRCHHGSPAQS